MPTPSAAISVSLPRSIVDQIRTSTAVLILVLATIGSIPFMVLSVANAGGLRPLWDGLHWSISAVGAALAAAWSIRAVSGRIRRVRGLASVVLILWAVATVAWAVMTLVGTPSVPSIADLCIVALFVPAAGLLVAAVRGRLTAAEEAAVYLDAALAFLLILALIVYVFGETALGFASAASVAALAYPAGFIGLGAAGLIAMLALGYPIVPRGAFALVCGSAIIGLAYLLWLAPSINLMDPGDTSSLLFTIGTLIVGYGAATWEDRKSTSVRYLNAARTTTQILAPTIASVLFLLVLAPAPDSDATILRVGIFAASILFVIRQGLLLRERTRTLAAVTTLTNENSRLVGELRAELDRRAIDQRRMIQASRSAAVGDLAAGVAHEVNNPLTGVLGFAELLIDGMTEDDPLRADVAVIRDEALRARDIVRALRDFASPRPPALAETDLSALVHQTVDLVRYSIERRGITIDEDLETLPPVLIDGSAIQQAILNVLTNARQAVDDGGRLEIAVRADGPGRLISITDDGIGMDAATAQLAFDPFFSGRDDAGDIEPAAGLGLSVSNGLIESHGGSISIQSRPGHGTTVKIHLPAGGTHAIGESRGGEAA
ncbi:MAG TPA: ATP-binding protein, partial [Candidatus Acidoferrum sp.]|nr:ATP-binding protein [Candidatus Acidoferrum sp.]